MPFGVGAFSGAFVFSLFWAHFSGAFFVFLGAVFGRLSRVFALFWGAFAVCFLALFFRCLFLAFLKLLL